MNPDQELYHILEATQQADQTVRANAESQLSTFLARGGMDYYCSPVLGYR
jgi:uncharacterized membrane protein